MVVPDIVSWCSSGTVDYICVVEVGDVAVQREVVEGYVWSAVPVVVAASGPRTALYRPRATVCWWPSHPRGEPRPPREVTQRGEAWGIGRFSGVLTLIEPGADYCISLMWREDWSFLTWYVDFIEPYRETSIGWDYADLHLDLLVAADGSVALKDEDELAVAVERGEVNSTRAEDGYRVLGHVADLARRKQGPFAESWPDWRPDPAWPHPALTAEAAAKLASSPTVAETDVDPAWWIDTYAPS